jgi:hypothetical protein
MVLRNVLKVETLKKSDYFPEHDLYDAATVYNVRRDDLQVFLKHCSVSSPYRGSVK